MKKVFSFIVIVTCVSLFSHCTGSKKAVVVKEPVPSFTYTGNIQQIMVEKCGPCHVAGKGNKLSLDNYEASMANVDDIIRRIELEPGARGFMPVKRPKLSDSVINIIKTWKAEGFPKG